MATSEATTTTDTTTSNGAGVPIGSDTTSKWDPLQCKDWDNESTSQTCCRRLQRDVMQFYNDPPHGIFMVPDEKNMTVIHSLIMGPYDTPYEGGFFYFLMRCPPDYPIRPPRVRLMTTAGNTVRFNPNLYADGKVCLSILGTWAGPCWSPASSVTSVLLSIQSLMNERPYHNEPGFEQEHRPGDADRYNDIIAHETVRVAVCEFMEQAIPVVLRKDGGREASSRDQRLTCTPPEPLCQIAVKSFPQFYDTYESVCQKYASFTGSPMQDPFGSRRHSFQWSGLVGRLSLIKSNLIAKQLWHDESMDGEAGSTPEMTSSSNNVTVSTSPTQPPLADRQASRASQLSQASTLTSPGDDDCSGMMNDTTTKM